ncbi:MAG: hypothetical protein H6741_33515 [Alphaproteobacteria bacterium]|nr:hypothetical protein [Alphaproteobacteria bacterium]
MLWLALSSLARAGDCPERITPEALEARVRAMEEPVLFLEDDAFEALAAFEGLLDGCVDGALTPEQIARVWISVGAGELLFTGALSPSAELRLGSALALVGPEGWLDVFGPDAEQAYLRSSAVALGGALLYVGLPQDTIVVLDGRVLYERGVVPSTPGLHLVQWQVDEVWQGELLTLEVGGRASPGGVPLPADLGAVEVSEGPSAARLPRLVTWERPQREPRVRPAPEPAAAALTPEDPAPIGAVDTRSDPKGGFGVSLAAGGGLGVLAGRISTDGYGVKGSAARPLILAEARAGGQWWGGLDVTLSPAARNGLPWPGSASVLGGWRGPLAGLLTLEAGLGGLLMGAPVYLVPEELPDPDEELNAHFDADRRLGVRLSARATLLDPRGPAALPLSLSAQARLDLSGGLMVLELGPAVSSTLGPVQPGLSWTPGLLLIGDSRLFRSALTLGVTWAL